MANVIVETQEVIVKKVEKKTVFKGIELTQNEIDALVLVLGKVAGSPEKSRRGYTDSVYNALRPYISDSLKEKYHNGRLYNLNITNCGSISLPNFDEEFVCTPK